MKIMGYTATDSKDSSKRYLTLEVLTDCQPGYNNGAAAGVKTTQLEADPSVESTLRLSTFPLNAEVEQTFKSVRTAYGEKSTVYVTAIKVPKAS